MTKVPRLLIVYLLITWPIMLAFMIATISGTVCISYHGFAIDDDKNLYLGKDSVIQVIGHNGEIVREINPNTSRGYHFTIVEDNTLKISTGDYLYTTDLSGKVDSKKEIFDYKDDAFIRESKHRFVASDGTEYVMKNHLFRTMIYRLDGNQNTVIYKMPVLDYIAKLSFYAMIISGFIVIPIIIIKWRKHN